MAHLIDIQYISLILFSDINSHEYFLLNSSFKELSSLIGLRFSIKSLHIRLELQSIQLRYKTRISSIEKTNCCKFKKKSNIYFYLNH
jgi:hypothetical protein